MSVWCLCLRYLLRYWPKMPATNEVEQPVSPGGGTDPKIARGGSARGKKLDPTGSVCRKNWGQKDLDITEIRGQKDLWNIHLVKNIYFLALPKLGGQQDLCFKNKCFHSEHQN